MTFVRLSDWPSDLTSYFTKTSHHAPVKVPKSKYNLQCLNLKLIAEGILCYFQTKVSSPAAVDKSKFACIVLRQRLDTT